ncbi:unnamed protein product [Paramecium sonneborni]|uniref:Uncharacterized protein n=1 Tax=Paramecium sonneborni TaxID=65129 RepID=A0A8S1LXE6_9CILI|nr:unnamed protein product [Paramecium sonneborni]
MNTQNLQDDDNDIVLVKRRVNQLEKELTFFKKQNEDLKNELDEANIRIANFIKLQEELSLKYKNQAEIVQMLEADRIRQFQMKNPQIDQSKGQIVEQYDIEYQIKDYKSRVEERLKKAIEDKNIELNSRFNEFTKNIEEKWKKEQREYFLKYQKDLKNKELLIEEKLKEISEKITENNNLKFQIDKLQIELKEPQKEAQKDAQKEAQNKPQKKVERQASGEEATQYYPSGGKTEEKYIAQNNINKREVNKKIEEEEERQKQLEQQEQRRQEQLIIAKQLKDKEQREIEEKKKVFKEMFQQIQKSHGIIEICFLVDITGSMDPYKEQARQCIKGSIEQIKKYTQKETRWSVVGYQDFSELKTLGGKYKELQFTDNLNNVEKFLDQLVCQGGGDAAEDIRGGIKQMVQLEWIKQFKLAILICDAPTHGQRYNGGVSDRYPKEDIEDAINLLIEKNIFLLAIQFQKTTQIMFEEIKKIYQAKGKTELLIIENAESVEISKLSNLFINLISNATQSLTQINNSASKINNRKNQKKQEIVSAMENLCKNTTDIVNFDKDPKIPTVPISFKVYRVELLKQSLEKNISDIKQLKLDTDFQTFEEPGIWKCIRTVNPFAEGSVKQVFLMKKEDTPTELYAIKMPLGDQTYKSKEEAIKDCRSHLIAKCFLQKFIKDMEKANMDTDKKINILNIQYSNFLVLQDSSKSDSFWVAERYFIGEFIKYNNNGAFILNDSAMEINHFAQAFSIYSYFQSSYNYMICDIQGIGQFFTDPALNTKEGKFDETDMGYEGIKDFLGTYQGRRHLGQEYLRVLNLNINL